MIKFAIAAAAALAIAAAPAVAKDGNWKVGNNQVHIVYSGINTSTPEGRATLLARVERAARQLCGGNHDVALAQRRCVQSVIKETAATSRNAALQLAWSESRGTNVASR